MKVYEFDAKLIKHDSINAAYIEFPYHTEREFGTKGQIKVNVTFDGCEYRGSLANMGQGCHCLGLTQKMRNDIGKQPGDVVHVILRKDEEPRNIDMPEDFNKLLENNSEAKEFFNSLSYTSRKEYVNWIISAKKVENRKKRIDEAIIKLSKREKLR